MRVAELAARICEGLRWRRVGPRISQLEKLANMFLEVTGIAAVRGVLVADAYYANRTVITPLLAQGHQLVSRTRSNAVPYEPAPIPETRGRGHPRKYGRKVLLRDLFKTRRCLCEAPSPVYGEQQVTIQYRSADLLWRPAGRIVRFVTDLLPSEIVVAHALRMQLPAFLLDSSSQTEVKQFILERTNYERIPGFKMVA